jgi:carboxyl-terminal processing protease
LLSRRGVVAATASLAAGLVLGAAAGVFADRSYPEAVPRIGPVSPRGEIDRATLDDALRVIQAHYYDRRLDYAAMSRGTVRGLVESLADPPSEYLDPAQYRRQMEGYAGRYTGVGIYVDFRADYPQITGVVPGSPADKAGIQPDDLIAKVDGRDARGLRAQQATSEIQGPEGTVVTLTIQRGGSNNDYRLRRASIALPTVRSITLEGGVLYVRIHSFAAGTAAEFAGQLAEGLRGARAMVLDLRDDPGGLIDAAVAVISDFVAEGEAFEQRDRDGRIDRTYVSGDHPAGSRPPLVVLVNADTASSSEIVAGALQVHRRARLVGVKTYGKASVQQDFPLSDGGDLHLTIRHWLLPDGTSVDGRGLAPDQVVELPSRDAMYDVRNPAAGHAGDAQLNAALALLAGS